MTEQQVLYKLTAMCSQAEHCSQEMLDKMKRWDIPEDVQARVMQYLTQEKFIDDERYCRFFVKDKIKYNKWGRRKVEQALYMKHIPSSISGPVLDEIPAEDYLEVLRPLLKSKRKTVKAATEYERNMKLIKFALGRGFSMDIIKDCIDDATEIDES
ncbi:MAG: RecX family transcriptional regulator [Prevotella sp.]|nr:RecX family transcriptional regulator [Prevotella sp.]MCI2080894.1 RecX family transcriptional regulator [Prevotella sp.]MCI2102788.1 RecX family transcriptional regulator [Prevotella sp.]